MSDVTIPEDVQGQAEAISQELVDHAFKNGKLVNAYLPEFIARAILAERKRGERICVERAQQHRASRQAYDDDASQNSCLSDAIEALSCAHAIRSSHE